MAKILVPEGSKDVPVGQAIAITVHYYSETFSDYLLDLFCTIFLRVIPFHCIINIFIMRFF